MENNKVNLDVFAAQIRLAVLESLKHLGFGHIGGSMSLAEAMAVLYGGEMHIDPQNPAMEDRDYLVLSKGHAGPVLYGTLALKGYFAYDMLHTMNTPGTKLPSHCSRLLTPGVDMSTGSLGQGVSTAIGMALGSKLQGKPNRVYLVVGDGECQEGQVWEGAMFAAHRKLGNLTMLVDYNKKQLDGYTDDVCSLGDIHMKLAAFGWEAIEVDGHDTADIARAFAKARESEDVPTAVILHTTKGKDCTFAEKELYNHHMTFTKEQVEEAQAMLQEKMKRLERGDA